MSALRTCIVANAKILAALKAWRQEELKTGRRDSGGLWTRRVNGLTDAERKVVQKREMQAQREELEAEIVSGSFEGKELERKERLLRRLSDDPKREQREKLEAEIESGSLRGKELERKKRLLRRLSDDPKQLYEALRRCHGHWERLRCCLRS